MQLKPNTKEIIYMIGVLFGLGVTWGTLSARVNAQSEAIKPIPDLVIKQAVIDTKLDYLIGLIEYRYGIRRAQPSRPGLRDR